MAGGIEKIPKFFVGLILAIIYSIVYEILKLFLLVLVSIVIPILFHLLGLIMPSWTSNERCHFGLFWISCDEVIGEYGNISKTESTGLDWAIPSLMLASTFILVYGCYAFFMTMAELRDIYSIQTSCSLFMSGVLDLGACLMVRSSCEDTCNLGISYYLTSMAGWMLVLAGTLLITPFLYFNRNEKEKRKARYD